MPPVIITLLFEPRLLTPTTFREVKVPTLVMFGWAAVVSVPVNKLALITFAPIILPPEPEPTVTVPVVLISPVFTLPTFAFPDADKLPITDNKLVVLSNVRLALAPALPASLNIT